MLFTLTLQVEEITVLCRRSHADRIYIKFLGPAPFPTFPNEGPSFQMDVAQGTGLEYARKSFGFEPKIVIIPE